MKDYLLNKRPRVSIVLVFILLISSILTTIFSQFYDILLLFPSNLNEPWNWYRLFTYPLYCNGLKTWLLNSIPIIAAGYIIESRVKRNEIIGVILISNVMGGLFYIILSQNDELNTPLASPIMISWGYWAAAEVIGIKNVRSLNLFERIVLVLCFVNIFSLWSNNLSFLMGQISSIVTIALFTLFRKNKISSAQQRE